MDETDRMIWQPFWIVVGLGFLAGGLMKGQPMVAIVFGLGFMALGWFGYGHHNG